MPVCVWLGTGNIFERLNLLVQMGLEVCVLHRLMASHGTCQVLLPAGALQTPQVGDIIPSAHRTRFVTFSMKMATWNVTGWVTNLVSPLGGTSDPFWVVVQRTE